MKKLLLSILLCISILCSFATVVRVQTYTVTNAGLTKVLPVSDFPDVIALLPSGGAVTLVGNVTFSFAASPPKGTTLKFLIAGNFDLNGNNFNIMGLGVPQAYVENSNSCEFVLTYIDAAGTYIQTFRPVVIAENLPQSISGLAIIDSTLSIDALDGPISISDLDTLGRGRILKGGASNVLTSMYAAGSGKILVGDGTDVNSVAVSGDVTLSTAGAVAIAAGAIVNADVNASAAIALSKLAALTASKVVVTDGSGVITTANQLSATLGGNGIDNSAATGFPTWSAGTQSVGVFTDTRDLHVSFATSSQGTYYIYFPVAVTVTNIEARVETALAATDSATLQIQDNSGTNMTGSNLTSGLLVMAASATTGTGYTSTLTANNTLTAGQRMRIITNKGTAGGTANVQVTYTRNN